MNALNIDKILDTYDTFYIATKRQEASREEVNRFVVDATEKGVNASYLTKIIKVVKDGTKIALKHLI